jgi:hypothetical protein
MDVLLFLFFLNSVSILIPLEIKSTFLLFYIDYIVNLMIA